MSKKLIVLGDSYSTLYFCVGPKDSFWDLAAKELQVDNIKPVDRDPADPNSWFGHHGSEGNLNWYLKVLLPKMRELSWV